MVTTNIVQEMRPFFFPRAIAMVGVSSVEKKFGSRMFSALMSFGFSGNLYPVGRRSGRFRGIRIYPSLADLPEKVDLAYICLPASYVPDAVEECKKQNIPAVLVLSAGFRDAGTRDGQELEATLTRLAGDGLRIIGPNCFGIYSPAGGLTMLAGPNFPRGSGGLGLLSQSGGLSAEVSRQSGRYGLRISQAVSYGNACDISELELLQYFEMDPQTQIVSIYIEGVRKGEGFFKILARLAPKKPVLIWKGGITKEGARAAATHTASLSGNEKIWAGLIRQTGAIQVHSLEDLLDAASALTHIPPQTDPRVAFICGGGGFGVAASDSCYREGLLMPSFSQEVQQKLATVLGPYGTSPLNPVDTGNPFPNTAMLRSILETIATSGDVGSIIIQTSLSTKMHQIQDGTDAIDREAEHGLEEVPVIIRKSFAIPVIAVIREGEDSEDWMSWESERRRIRHYYHEHGIPVYPTFDRACQALGRVVKYYRYKNGVEGKRFYNAI